MKLRCGHKPVKWCLQVHLSSWQSSGSVDHCHLFSHQQKLFSSSRHLSLNFWQDLTLVIYLTGCFLCFPEPNSAETGRNLKIKVFFTGADSWMVVGGTITVSGALLGALFSAWIFPSCPCCSPSFPYCTIEYTALQLLTEKQDRFE